VKLKLFRLETPEELGKMENGALINFEGSSLALGTRPTGRMRNGYDGIDLIVESKHRLDALGGAISRCH